jgi:hypothetical protein
MSTFADKSEKHQRRALTERPAQGELDSRRTLQPIDQRPAAVTQRALGESLNRSDKVQSQLQLQQMFDQSPRVAAQMKLAAVLSGQSSTLQPQQPVQRQEALEDEEMIQRQESLEEDELLENESATAAMQRVAASVEQVPVESSEVRPASHSDLPVQLTVQSRHYPLKKGGTLVKYYSTYDENEEFDDHMKAWKYDTKLALAARKREGFDPEARYPTNFTYYNTDSRNVPGTNKQGPHSLSHSSTAYRLEKRLGDTDAKDLMKAQIPDKDEFEKRLEAEAPKTLKKIQKERYITDYGLLYDRLTKLLDTEDYDETAAHELIMRLMQMNPYSAYGKGKRLSQKAMKNKSERKDDPFKEAFDYGANFRDKEGYEKFKEMRKDLYSDAESSSEEEHEEESSSESEEEVKLVKKKRKLDVNNNNNNSDSESDSDSDLDEPDLKKGKREETKSNK